MRVVSECAKQCLRQARLAGREESIVACLALAGASEPEKLAAAKQARYPFRSAVITTDARAACIGAHQGGDGGIVIAGTGSIGWAILNGREYRVGGWGFPLSDEGSGAWIGFAALKQLLWAHDGTRDWTDLLKSRLRTFRRQRTQYRAVDGSCASGGVCGTGPHSGGSCPTRRCSRRRRDVAGCHLHRSDLQPARHLGRIPPLPHGWAGREHCAVSLAREKKQVGTTDGRRLERRIAPRAR